MMVTGVVIVRSWPFPFPLCCAAKVGSNLTLSGVFFGRCGLGCLGFCGFFGLGVCFGASAGASTGGVYDPVEPPPGCCNEADWVVVAPEVWPLADGHAPVEASSTMLAVVVVKPLGAGPGLLYSTLAPPDLTGLSPRSFGRSIPKTFSLTARSGESPG